MAARKSKARKTSKKGLVETIERELKDLSKDVERRLKPLRKEIEKAERKAGTQTAKLLRQTRVRLNKVEIRGESELQMFLRRQRRQISKGLTETEKAVRPKRKKAAGKTSPRKKAARRRRA